MRTLATALCLALAFSAMSVRANEDEWQFTLLFPMVWAPDVKGDIDFGGDNINVDTPFEDKIENLDLGLIGEFYAEKGHIILGARLNYLRSKDDTTTEGISIPGGPTLVSPHRLETVTEEGTFDVLAGYKVTDSKTNRVYIYGGVRRFGQSLELDIEALEDDGLGFNGKYKLIDDWYDDAILGASWNHHFNQRWSVGLGGDLGVAGDSDENYFLNFRVGYSFSELNNIWFGYRGSRIALTTGSGLDKVKTDFKQHGPTVGWAFTF